MAEKTLRKKTSCCGFSLSAREEEKNGWTGREMERWRQGGSVSVQSLLSALLVRAVRVAVCS